MIQEIYDIECEYSNLLYQEVGMLEEVKFISSTMSTMPYSV